MITLQSAAAFQAVAIKVAEETPTVSDLAVIVLTLVELVLSEQKRSHRSTVQTRHKVNNAPCKGHAIRDNPKFPA